MTFVATLPSRHVTPNDTPAESPKVVAFQGERGAYGDLAITAMWGAGGADGEILRERCWTFEGVIAAVARGGADAGVLPVHNVIVGAIPGVEALIEGGGVQRVGDVTVPIRHALLGIPGSTRDRIRVVMSHPVALAQCRTFLDRHPQFVRRERYDTAGAAREVAAHGSLGEGAIADVGCAERYGLEVLARDIGDRRDNATRFAVIVRAGHVRR